MANHPNVRIACLSLLVGMSFAFLKQFIGDFSWQGINWGEVIAFSIQVVGFFLLTKYILKPSWLDSEKNHRKNS